MSAATELVHVLKLTIHISEYASVFTQTARLGSNLKLHKIGGSEVEISSHVVQMHHGAVVCRVHGLANAGFLSLH